MFDSNKFGNTKFERRTEAVPVTALADFFPKGETVEFTVGSLTHHELAQCAAGLQAKDNTKSVLQAVAGHNPSIKEAIGEILGGKADIPVDTQKRILHLVKGSIEPVIDEMFAVQLAERFPVEFTMLTNKILELSGLGQVAIKKP